MDDIESNGGPLICIESRLSHQWLGIDGLSIAPDASTEGISTDYERTGQRPDKLLDVLNLAHGAALILGDRPMITGVWKNAPGQVTIWRISYAEEDDIPAMLASLSERSFERPRDSIEFSFDSSKVLIFDSAYPGNEKHLKFVSFEIAPGRYQVTTHVVKPAPRTELVLHRFNSIE
jgi:hypothetical protein